MHLKCISQLKTVIADFSYYLDTVLPLLVYSDKRSGAGDINNEYRAAGDTGDYGSIEKGVGFMQLAVQ